MFNKYYQDELNYLRELGREFAKAHPASAHLLSEEGAEAGTDPDVERLLEGFAFLTGRVRQKLDDELPELTHTMMGLLWPHYLRPIPSTSILEFDPMPHMVAETQRIPRGVEIESIPVDGTKCRFRTCFDVEVLPIVLREVSLESGARGPESLNLRFTLNQGATLDGMEAEGLRFHLHGDSSLTDKLYLWLTKRLKGIVLRAELSNEETARVELTPENLKPAGFGPGEAIFPYPEHAFSGYRLLQEYFSLPAKFLFLDLNGLERLKAEQGADAIEVRFLFEGIDDAGVRVSRDNIRLNCTPVANLFSCEADPIRLEHNRVEYRVRPAGYDPLHGEIYSVDSVTGIVQGTAEVRDYPPFFSFVRGADPKEAECIYYRIRLHPSTVGGGTTTYIAFVDKGESNRLPLHETISLELTCTNRTLPEQLRPGDISVATGSSPVFATFRNISAVTPSVPPPLGGDLHWRLISHLSLNYLSLTELESLRGILGAYNFQALRDRQAARANELRLSGLKSIRAVPSERLLQGVPVRGTVVEIELVEDHFAGEGEMVLFASILNEFLALYASMNTFSELVVHGVQQGETYRWPPRLGDQIVL
ncbi:type VI secretion system baseplate subunit TssF [Thermodesulfobacteriota bacterium]